MTGPETPTAPQRSHSPPTALNLQSDRLFLRRSGYRQRRLRDALRLLPIAGGVLWLIPIFWTGETTDPVGNAGALIYVFLIWALLIGLALLLSLRIRLDDDGRGALDRASDDAVAPAPDDPLS